MWDDYRTASNERGFPFSKGSVFETRLEGKGIGRHRRDPYAWVERVRTFITDRFNEDRIEAFPGDNVRIRITGMDNNHAHATVLENQGTYLDEISRDETFNIKITDYNYLDARNAISDPRKTRDGGIYGVRVIVDECKCPESSYDPLDAEVTVRNFVRAKKGGYFLFSKLTDLSPDMKREPYRDLFYSVLECHEPGLSLFKDRILGVPVKEDLNMALSISGNGKITILKQAYNDEISNLGMEDGIRMLKEKTFPSSFPLVVVRDEGIEDKFVRTAKLMELELTRLKNKNEDPRIY